LYINFHVNKIKLSKLVSNGYDKNYLYKLLEYEAKRDLIIESVKRL
jgi:hypothetical protein